MLITYITDLIEVQIQRLGDI